MLEPTTGAQGGAIDGILYVAGGSGSSSGPTANLEAYNPLTNTWSQKAPMNFVGVRGAGAVVDGRLYMLGGCVNSDCGGGASNRLDVYDPQTDSWSAKAAMPTPRYNFGAVSFNGKIYAVGGFNACPPCFPQIATLEVYDVATDAWTTKTPMPTVREGLQLVAFGDKIYALGGCIRTVPSSSCTATGVLEIYEPAKDRWTTGAPMPTARQNVGVVVLRGKLYAFGGYADGSTTVVHEIYEQSKTWVTQAPMFQPGASMVAGVIASHIYAAGGAGLAPGTAGAVLQIYQP